MSNSPFSTRGGCSPVVHDADKMLVHTCRRPNGGDRTIQAPQFHLTVTNAGLVDDLFSDENDSPVVDDGLDPLILNQ